MADQYDANSPNYPLLEPTRSIISPAMTRPPTLRGRSTVQSRPNDESNSGVQFVLAALRRWWMIATPLGILLAIVSSAVVFLLFRPEYEAQAWLRIEEHTPYIAFESRDQNQNKLFVQTQRELIRSPLVIGPVLSRPEIARIPELVKQSDPITWLGKQVSVLAVGESELFRVVFSNPDAGNAARVVNAVIDSYFNLRDQDEAERVQRVIELLDQERDRRAGEVSRLREDVRELAKQTPGAEAGSLTAESDANNLRSLGELQSRIITTEVEQEVLQARIRALEEALKSQESLVAPEALVQRSVEDNPEVQDLKSQISLKRTQLRDIQDLTVRNDKDPNVQRLTRGIEQNEKALKELRIHLRQQAQEELRLYSAGKRAEELANLRSELEARKITVKLLSDRYEQELKNVRQVSGDTLELEFKRAELARAEQVFGLIAERALKLRTEQRAPPRVSLLKRADPPAAPIEYFPYRNILLASLAGLCLPFLLAVAREKLARRINDADQLESESHLDVIGEIVRLPARARISRPQAVARTNERLQLFEESVDSLRTGLLLPESLRNMKVLAITSAAKREGKTSVAAQLAVSLSRASEEAILLIDGDLRSPDIHKIFGIPLQPGLIEVLNHQASLDNAIVTGWNACLHLLPAGQLTSSPHRLFGNGALKWLLEQLLPRYRYILIDTPPVLAASEALILAKAADATLVCAMRDLSRVDQVKKAYSRLSAVGAHTIGAVLNGVPAHRYAYDYGYGYETKTPPAS
jgi:succinoglycan biosynthesis transport protein ExoP